jgi:hypothetical protein
MKHRYSAQRASVLARPIVPGGERLYQQARMRFLWKAAGRDAGGWIAPVLPPGWAQARPESHGQRRSRSTAPRSLFLQH